LGSEDVIVSDAEAEAMAEAVGSVVHRVEAGSHFPFVDAVDAFDAALLAVLAQIDRH
jgi:pimeloyl-ACP methyl ester carboxylesterase